MKDQHIPAGWGIFRKRCEINFTYVWGLPIPTKYV